MLTTSDGRVRNSTPSHGTRVPTLSEKFTFSTDLTCSLRITLVILVRCSVESLAEAPAWPVVLVVDLLVSDALLPSRPIVLSRPSDFRLFSRPSDFMLSRPSRPSDFMFSRLSDLVVPA